MNPAPNPFRLSLSEPEPNRTQPFEMLRANGWTRTPAILFKPFHY